MDAIDYMVMPYHREVPCSEYHSEISMAGKCPAIDEGESDDRVEAKPESTLVNALPGAMVDAAWVAQ